MLLSIVVSLSITLGPKPTATLDINPTFIINTPLSRVAGDRDWNAVTLPHVILFDFDSVQPAHLSRLLREERLHAEQWTALGPWFPIAYAATLGEAFEPYPTRKFWQTNEMNLDWNRAWAPGPALAQRCPLIRINQHGPTLLPCWTSSGGTQ